MKRLFTLLLLAFSTIAWGAPALVQQATAVSVLPGTSGMISLSSVASNHLIVLIVGSQGNTTFTAADSQSQTVTSACSGGASQGAYNVFYIQGALSGTHTETVTAAASTNWTMLMLEFSGVPASGAFDKCGTQATGFGTAIAASSVTPAASGELAIMALGTDTGSPTVSSWGAPLTAGNGGYAAQMGYGVLSSASAFGGTATYSASNDWITAVALFNASAGSACTHAGWTKTGAETVPTAGSTLVWLKTGAFGTVDCSTTNYWQPAIGHFGTN